LLTRRQRQMCIRDRQQTAGCSLSFSACRQKPVDGTNQLEKERWPTIRLAIDLLNLN
jgi:hypothetical protein